MQRGRGRLRRAEHQGFPLEKYIMVEALNRTLQTAPEPPVRRLGQVFTADELREAGLPGRSTAQEFRVRWENRDPEAVQVVRDLAQTQVERIVIARRLNRGKSFD